MANKFDLLCEVQNPYFGEKIESLREEMNLTRKKLAKLCRTHERTISFIETNKNTTFFISIKTLQNLAMILEVPTSYLVEHRT